MATLGGSRLPAVTINRLMVTSSPRCRGKTARRPSKVSNKVTPIVLASPPHGLRAPVSTRQLSLFDYLHSSKSSKTGGFACTDRKMAARMDFCPHEPEVGSHGTPKCPHRSNFRRTEGKMAARNDFCPHGGKDSPHGSISRVWEPIFARTEGLWLPPKASGSCARPI